MGGKNSSLRNLQRRSIGIAATVFLLPALFFLVVFILYPIIDSFITSTLRWSSKNLSSPVFTGLDNWKTLLSDNNFWKAFSNNIRIMFLSLLFQVPFAMALATFLDTNGRRAYVFKVVWFLPYLLSSVAIGVLFKFAFEPSAGIFGSISAMFGGGAIDLLGNSKRALYAVIGVVCWQYIPFYMVLYLAAYGTVPVELYEAASIDGASRRQYFWFVSLPMLLPTVISGMILSIIGSLKYFDLIFVMTGGGPGVATELMATYMYSYFFEQQVYGYGSAVAVGMFILITVIAVITVTVLNRKTTD